MASFLAGALKGLGLGGASPSKGADDENILYRFVKKDWDIVKEGVTWETYDDAEDSRSFKWILSIGGEVEEAVDDSLAPHWDTPGLRLTFRTETQGIYSFKLKSREEYDNFADQFDRALFENRHQTEYSQDAVREVFKNYEAWIEGKDDEEEFMSVDGEGEADAGDVEASQSTRARRDDEEFSFMNVGAGSNSFAVRGSHVDVFRNAPGGMLDANVSINVTPARGAAFTPAKSLLTDQESKMLLLSPAPGGASQMTPPASAMRQLFHMDLEREQVVREFAFKKDDVEIPVMDIVHDDKAAGLQGTPTFLAIDTNRICRFDTRAASGVVADLTYEGGRDYSRGTNFTCIATAGNGEIVTGSRDGRLRLYRSKDSLSRASTNLPSFGSPITHVDVTFDGKWVLATTDQYLMLVKTTFKDAKGNATSGFFKSMSGSTACQPRLLQLRPEDMATVREWE